MHSPIGCGQGGSSKGDLTVGALRAGLYESLLTAGLDRQLSDTNDLAAVVRAIDPAEQPDVLARHIRDAAFRTLSAQRDPAKRVELVNTMLGLLDQLDETASGDPRQLLSLSRPAAPGHAPLSTIRPAIPLSDAALLTNAPNEPSLRRSGRSWKRLTRSTCCAHS